MGLTEIGQLYKRKIRFKIYHKQLLQFLKPWKQFNRTFLTGSSSYRPLSITRGVRDENRVSRSGMPRRERREGSLGEKRIYILCPSHLCLCAS